MWIPRLMVPGGGIRIYGFPGAVCISALEGVVKRTILMIALVIAGGALWIFSQTAPAQQRTLVLRGGLLIDGTGGTPLINPVVVISGGKIQSVGQEGSVSVPANATIIDTSGKTILPGLVDSHMHL